MQEFLQSVVREFQRRVGENHASEDTWPFVRYLNDCEGYVRVQRLRETDRRVSRPGGNQVAAQFKRHPEQELIGALQTRFKHGA